jgi:hypothetical protein
MSLFGAPSYLLSSALLNLSLGARASQRFVDFLLKVKDLGPGIRASRTEPVRLRSSLIQLV